LSVRKGRILNNVSTDPYYNLALDHTLLIQNPRSEYVATIRFWINQPSVILGRNQNLSNEVNQVFCRNNHIPIARRITGGGTVYHDEGNINISLLFSKMVINNPYNIRDTTLRFTNLLKKSLEASDMMNISIDDANNLFYQNRKVSGAAAYFTRDTILHHSTLLITTNLDKLEGSLIHHKELHRGLSKYTVTTNLIGLQVGKWKTNYTKLLEESFKVHFQPVGITTEEDAYATKLTETMYCKPRWIIEGEKLTEA
jgi:lipoate-protein ligase A